MGHEARSQRAGWIEAEETFLGGPAKGKNGRGVANAAHKSLVVEAVAVLVYQDTQGKRRERAGRLRRTLIPEATEERRGTF